jgi:hypothetical protein
LGSYENKNAPLWNQGVARPTSVGPGAPCAKSLAKVAKNAKLSFGLCGLCERFSSSWVNGTRSLMICFFAPGYHRQAVSHESAGFVFSNPVNHRQRAPDRNGLALFFRDQPPSVGSIAPERWVCFFRSSSADRRRRNRAVELRAVEPKGLASYENKNAPLWNQSVARPTSVGPGAPCAKSLAKVAKKNAKLSFGLCGLCRLRGLCERFSSSWVNGTRS